MQSIPIKNVGESRLVDPSNANITIYDCRLPISVIFVVPIVYLVVINPKLTNQVS